MPLTQYDLVLGFAFKAETRLAFYRCQNLLQVIKDIRNEWYLHDCFNDEWANYVEDSILYLGSYIRSSTPRDEIDLEMALYIVIEHSLCKTLGEDRFQFFWSSKRLMKPHTLWHTQVKFWFKADWIDPSISRLASPSRLDAFIDKVETVLGIKGANTAGLLRLLSQDDLHGSPWSTLATIQPDRVSEPTYLTRETFEGPATNTGVGWREGHQY